MKKNERMRDKYPIFGCYGAKQTFLTDEQMEAATREERIRSIWPFIVRKALAFQGSLKPRERVNFDAEDVHLTLWIAIAEKDSLWSRERGRYITFAGVIIDRTLHKIRDRARTVESPKNSTCRTKEYAKEEEAGILSSERRKTMFDIRRTKGEIKSIAQNDRVGDRIDGQHYLADDETLGPLDEAMTTDSALVASTAINDALRCLTPFEATVITALNGLGGAPRWSAWEIAWREYAPEEDVRKAASRASRKIRSYLLSIGHPATTTA